MKTLQIGKRLSDYKQSVSDLTTRQQLLSANEIISNKKILKGVCVVISLFTFLLLSIVLQAFTHIPAMLSGSFSLLSLLQYDFQRFGILYLIFFVVSCCIGLYFYYKIRTNFRDLNVGQKGDARFLTLSEIKQVYKAIPDKFKPFDGRGGLPVCREGHTLYIDDSITNNLIVAITRSGKGELLVIPSIDILSRAKDQSSMIVFDVKGELSRACIPHLLQRGYRVNILDLIDTDYSMYFNLLEIATQYYENGDASSAEEVCRATAFTLFDEPNTRDRYWVNAPIDLFCAVALAHIDDCLKSGERHKINMYSVTVFISTLESIKDPQRKESALDDFFLSRAYNDRARLKYTTIEFSEGKTRASLLSICAAKLSIFTYEKIARITSRNTIDLERIGFDKDQPTAVFLRVPFHKVTFHAIASIFVAQAYFILMDKAAKNKGKCLRPVKVIADEAFNFPSIEHIDVMLSVGLGAQFSFDLYAQSYRQIKKVYGEDAAEIIADNCSNLFYLMSPAESTREMVSKKLGKYTNKNINRTGSRFSTKKSFTEMYEEKDLLSPNQLERLQEGEMVVIPTMKRRDLEGEKISSLPVFATGRYKMQYRYEYLPEFDTFAEIDYNRLGIKPESIDLHTITYIPNFVKDKVLSRQHKSLSLTDILSSDKLQMIQRRMEDSKIDIDYSRYTVNEFKDLLVQLYHSGDLSSTDFKMIGNMLI